MMNDKMTYAMLAALSQKSSSLSRNERMRESLLAAFTADNTPMATLLTSKRFIEREEAKSEQIATQADLNTSLEMFNAAVSLIEEVHNHANSGSINWPTFADALPERQRFIFQRALPNISVTQPPPLMPNNLTPAQLPFLQFLNIFRRQT